MKRSQHECYTAGCDTLCSREYPFCASCWRKVPKELRARVREELAKRKTPDLDRSGLYLAINTAAASIQEQLAGTCAREWEDVYKRAGKPAIDERVLGLL